MDKKVSELFKSKKKIITVIVAVLICCTCINGIKNFIYVKSLKNNDLVSKIYDSYYENSAVCIKEYNGKEVKFKCKIASISTSLNSMTVVSPFVGEPYFSAEWANCKLSTEKLKKQALELKSGDIIKVEGTIKLLKDVDGSMLVVLETKSIS